MPQPESYGAPSSGDRESSGEVRNPDSGQDPTDVTEVARTLAAHGGGAASFDLALDLVLNEVVEQARLATGATGAAIALARAGEMVCRATTGGVAPDLGVRLETKSGLSGACLQTGTIQRCSDAETDPRVNAEASRSLGARSILVVPLSDGKERFGILEVFSPRPNAFGERDINTLQVLARRAADNKRGVEESATVFNDVAGSSAPVDEVRTSSDDEDLQQPDFSNPIGSGSPKGREVWTTILGMLVIAVAVLLGLALGWRLGIGRGLQGADRRQATVRPDSSSRRVPNSTGERAMAPASDLSTNAGQQSADQAKALNTTSPEEPPSGGLQVTQNGKVIYRLPPAEEPGSASTSQSLERSEMVSATRLIHRVEPEYPPEARAQHIQGAVRLDIQIGGEGAVHNIEVVEGDPLLAAAAVQAVRQWRYRPYSVDGRAIEMQTRVTIRFTLPPN